MRYFGLGKAPAHSLESVGHPLGLSRERCRQLRNQALAAMRG
jgi:DNA-directed RNA polymerase sigma subunit (sigma70/sigma32)